MKIDGRHMANVILDRLKQIKFNKTPSLAIIHVGDRPDATAYIHMKQKKALAIGFNCYLKKYEDISQLDLINAIRLLNRDAAIDGILVQLPLPPHLDDQTVINSIDESKDVDGLTRFSIGRLSSRLDAPKFIPCTARACMHILHSIPYNVQGKHAVVIGTSDLVGRPVGQLLIREGATVTFCHSKSKSLSTLIGPDEIVVVAIRSCL